MGAMYTMMRAVYTWRHDKQLGKQRARCARTVVLRIRLRLRFRVTVASSRPLTIRFRSASVFPMRGGKRQRSPSLADAPVAMRTRAFPFVVDAGAAGAAGARAGRWGGLPTPGALLQTQYGQPINMLRDVLATLPRDPTHAAAVRFPHMWSLSGDVASRPGRDLATYCNLDGRAAVLLLRDPASFVTVPATDACATVITWGGRRRVTPAEYVAAVRALRPDAAVVLHDEVAPGAGNNRTREALARSLRWMDACVAAMAAPPSAPSQSQLPAGAAPLFAATSVAAPSVAAAAGAVASVAAAGSPPPPQAPSPPLLLAYVPVLLDAAARGRAVADVVARIDAANRGAAAATAQPAVIGGVVLGGLFLGEPAAARRAALADTVARLPPGLVRLLSGPRTALEMLDAAAVGVDVVDSDYATCVTRFGCAAAFRIAADAAGSGEGGVVVDGDEGVSFGAGDAPAVPISTDSFAHQRHGFKSTAPQGGAATAAGAAAPPPPPAPLPPAIAGDGSLLNLRDKRFAGDPRPLVAGCPCIACAGTGGGPAADASAPPVTTGAPAGDAPPASPRPVTPHAGYSRGYIHHLLETREMLGDVLLTAHNTTHAGRFLEAVRRVIVDAEHARATSAAAPVAAAPADLCGPTDDPIAAALARYRAWFVRVNCMTEADDKVAGAAESIDKAAPAPARS